MKDKKLEWKRIGIFITLAYGINWTSWIIIYSIAGSYEKITESPLLSFLWVLLMFPPALSNILTRIITKEGMENSLLSLKLNGKMKYYIAPLFLPILIAFIIGIICSFVFTDGFSIKAIDEQAGGFAGFAGNILYMISISAATAYITFGEEFGWRGYLYPKLEKLIGMPKAVILGGIIWGMWHAPIIANGYNFGTDYPGAPFIGLLIMCIFCIAGGSMLMWLTKKTDSIYPASIAHAIINNCTGLVVVLIAPETDKIIENDIFHFQLVHMLSASLIYSVFAFLLIRESRKKTVSNT